MDPVWELSLFCSRKSVSMGFCSYQVLYVVLRELMILTLKMLEKAEEKQCFIDYESQLLFRILMHHCWFCNREVKVRCYIDINVLNIEYHSDDNENTAHYPDAFNTKWCIQTPAQKISITTNTVSWSYIEFHTMILVCFTSCKEILLYAW